MSMDVRPFFDPATSTLTYVVADGADAVVIDPVLDYDPAAGRVRTGSVEALAAHLDEAALHLHWVLETHAHADHLSASRWLAARFGAKTAIGHGICAVQETFRVLLDLPDLRADGSQFDRLVVDGDVVEAGALRLRVLETPGHTPGCVSYLAGDALFTGDALFIEDYGTGRCDFPGGDAARLYDSVHGVLYGLPDETRVFPGHDYQPNGRALRTDTTVGRSKAENVQLRADTARDAFVEFRRARDAKLSAPALLYPAIQVNVDGGRLPPKRANGRRYLVVPITAPPEDDPR